MLNRQPAPSGEVLRSRPYEWWLLAGSLIALGAIKFPPLAVMTICVLFAARDLRTGRLLARSMPSKAGGTICSRFAYAWGAFKFGAAGFAMLFVSAAVFAPMRQESQVVSSIVSSLMLGAGGFAVSAGLTALGLLAAYRSGMRVWIGEGVNRARTLFLGMLLVVFTFAVLGPICIWLVGRIPPAPENRSENLPAMIFLFGCMFGGPAVILLILDWISRRVIADRPGKFGPKVPTVGKWDS